MNQAEGYLAVFKSRNHTMKFYQSLKDKRIPCQILNTPRQLSLGCGLSVRFPATNVSQALSLLRALNLYSYAGMFAVTAGSHGPVYTPYY